MRLTGIGLCIATLAVSGCGVLFTSQQSHVPLSSTPTGAQILVDGNHVGQTPMVHEFKNNKDYVITFRMEGHREQSCMLNRSVRAGIVVLDVLGGLVPVIVDAATGSWYKLDKADCTVLLQPDT